MAQEKPEKVRVQVDFPQETIEYIDRIRARKGATRAEFFRRAGELYARMLQDYYDSGVEPHGKDREGTIQNYTLLLL